MGFSKAKSAILSQYITVKDLFRNIPRHVLKEILNCTIREFIRGGETLFHQGEKGNDLFIVLAGRLKYEKYGEGGKIDEGEFLKMDLLGELSVFTGAPRSASVIALRDSELIRIPKELALPILVKYPESLLRITTVIAERLAVARKNLKFQKIAIKTISFVPTSSFSEFPDFVQTVCEALQNFGKIALIQESDYEMVKSQFQQDVERDHQIIHWFQELESSNDYLILVCGLQNGEWEKICLRQSDRVVLVQNASEPPKLSVIEGPNQEKRNSKTMDLVLLQKRYPELPKGSIHHLEIRSIRQHYHVHLGQLSTVNRMVRGILGKSVGVAFGGGGAKGFAHLGVLKAMEEAGVEIDQVSGTSAGSIFAALCALQYSSDEARKEAKHLWLEKDLLNEYTIPVLSIVAGRKYTEAIRYFFKDICIEDLWIPYYAFSTNLTSSIGKVHSTGFLWKAIRCSTALPGIVPPFFENGEVFIDGGVLDNVPGLILRERGVGILICTDVYGDHPPEKDRDLQVYYDPNHLGASANPAIQLLQMVNLKDLFQPKFPPIGEIITRAILVSGRQRILQTEESADLYLRIPTNDFGVMDWSSYEKLIDLGYEFSSPLLKKFANQKKIL